MPAKLTRCVADVKQQLHQRYPSWSDDRVTRAAWGICIKSTGLKPHHEAETMSELQNNQRVSEADCHAAACGKRSNYALSKGDKVSDWALPYKNCDGSINKACLRNALARWNQVQGYSSAAKQAALARLRRAARSAGIGVSDEELKLPPDPISERFTFTAPFKILEQAPTTEAEKKEPPVVIISGRAINATTTLNNLVYSPDELRVSAPTLEGRTVFKDHNYSTDSVVGQVVEAQFAADNTGIDYEAALLRSDPVVEKVELGLISKVSIGATVEDVFCSICGESMSSCRHLLGREYDGKIARGNVHGIKFIELSLTPFPGDQSSSASVSQSLDEALTGKIHVAESYMAEAESLRTPEVENRMSDKSNTSDSSAEKQALIQKELELTQATEKFKLLEANARKRLSRDILSVEERLGRFGDETARTRREAELQGKSMDVLEGIAEALQTVKLPTPAPSKGLVGGTPTAPPDDRERKKDLIRQFLGFGPPTQETRKVLRRYNVHKGEWGSPLIQEKKEA